jgi:ABC-type dipeptide/oligopeptide/nickel transport system ATPase subunit
VSTAPVLEARDVRVHYGRGPRRKEVLRGVDLSIAAGEIVGLRGPSGCGKSTLLRVLTTVERPSAGELLLAGEPTRRPRRDGFIMPISQNSSAALDPRWPIWRTITEPLTAPHVHPQPSTDERREIAQERLASVGLQGIGVDCKPGQLSGGQRQRVTILRALVARPRLLVADEPTSALDVSVAAGVLNLLAEAASSGTALIVASHDRLALSVLCHRVFEIQDGRLTLLEEATPVRDPRPDAVPA